jgi:hypothetical protein
MTEQITIKLNKEKFERILDELMDFSAGSATYSEVTGKALWFLYIFYFKKLAAFGNKTHLENMLEMRKLKLEQFFLDVQDKYAEFLRTGKPF